MKQRRKVVNTARAEQKTDNYEAFISSNFEFYNKYSLPTGSNSRCKKIFSIIYSCSKWKCCCLKLEDDCEHDGDLRLVHKTEDNYGALQVCISQYGWRYIIPSGWTQAAARLACRQLNLGYDMSEKQNNSNPIIIRTLFLQTLHQEVWSCPAMYT